MIETLHILNFKSHKDTALQLSNLNILTGINGSGKSSVIQSLLLLRQSYIKGRLEKGLELNKPLCEIGTGKDAVFQFSEDDFVQFSIKEWGRSSFTWQFSAASNRDLNAMYLPPISSATPYPLSEISLFNNQFQYLSAGRLPGLKYKRDDFSVEVERQLSLENGYGELVAQYLFHYANETVDAALCNKNNKFSELIHQVTAWEREINPNVNVFAQKEGDDFTIKYTFDGDGNASPTDEFKTENVGFGLTYVLPIIVAILSASKGSLLLIENPEAHLHPQGQSKLAELIALAAQSGIQIIIETHSDHIINGILVACKRFESCNKGIDHKKVKLFYFGDKDHQHASTFVDIEVLQGGKISEQPAGFLDQMQQDLEVILGF